MRLLCAVLILSLCSCSGEDLAIGDSLGTQAPSLLASPRAESRLSEPDFSGLKAAVDGQPCSLGQGKFLLAFLSTSCDSCEQDITILNDLSKMPGVPPVIGFVLGDEESLVALRERTKPEFSTTVIEAATFFKYIGSTPPRFFYISDNRQLGLWDNRPPAHAELVEIETSP